MNETIQVGIEQGRAKFAYREVQENIRGGKKYKNAIKKAAMLIRTNGLANTIAYLKGKDSGEKTVCQNIVHYFNQTHCRHFLSDNNIRVTDATALLRALMLLNSPQYRACTIETMALLNWLKRFSDGLIPKE